MRLQTYTKLPYQKKNPKNTSSVYYIYKYIIISLARSSYLYLQHVATQKKLNGVQSYSQLHPNAQNNMNNCNITWKLLIFVLCKSIHHLNYIDFCSVDYCCVFDHPKNHPTITRHRFTVLAAGDLDQVGAIGALPSVPSVALEGTTLWLSQVWHPKTRKLHNWPTTGPRPTTGQLQSLVMPKSGYGSSDYEWTHKIRHLISFNII